MLIYVLYVIIYITHDSDLMGLLDLFWTRTIKGTKLALGLYLTQAETFNYSTNIFLVSRPIQENQNIKISVIDQNLCRSLEESNHHSRSLSHNYVLMYDTGTIRVL